MSRPTRFHQTQVSDTGLSPTMAKLSSLFSYQLSSLRASPRSLAATEGISVDFFSSGYLDVSVPPVRPVQLCIHCTVPTRKSVGFPIQRCPDHSSFASSPNLIAGFHVFHRL